MRNNHTTPDNWSWTCRCGQNHPLRHRKCSHCQDPMPQSIRTAVYKAELSFQRALHRDFTIKRSTRRMDNLDKSLRATLALMILVAVLLTGYICYDRFDIAMLRLEAFWCKVTTLELDGVALAERLSFISARLMEIPEKLSIIPDRNMDALEKLLTVVDRAGSLGSRSETMPHRALEATSECVFQISHLLEHINERATVFAEYVKALLNDIQK